MYKPIIIVEGKNDRRIVQAVLDEEIEVICTFGTFSIERFDELLEEYMLDDREVFLLVDEDEAGLKLRQELHRELPHAIDLHVKEDTLYVEDATTVEIAAVLQSYFKVKIFRK